MLAGDGRLVTGLLVLDRLSYGACQAYPGVATICYGHSRMGF